MQKEIKVNPEKFKRFFQHYGTKGNILTGVGVLSVAGLVGYAIKFDVFRNLYSRIKKGRLSDINLPVTR